MSLSVEAVMVARRKPGSVRDAILEEFKAKKGAMSMGEIAEGVETRLGESVARSSIRSYLNLNTPGTFERTGRGTYRLVRGR
ncbi:site-specific DNA-methyltransferase (adenine-specific) [Nocardioides salarius]|uniref:Site-specific DNA-methyltransferase (Adenine-specific) n=1 Tax=Nocardioides salarius TaxID=374513 RepID=A0ABS2M7E6_9ACTN|nr:site-specific DNA-methyltransferase (adenine-specific) [Nocardioides salarius]